MQTAAIIPESRSVVKRHQADGAPGASGMTVRGTHHRGVIDQETRERIRAWIAYEMKRRDISSIRAFAEKIGVSHAYVSRVLSGDQTPGLELVLRLHRRLHISADVLLDHDPPTR